MLVSNADLLPYLPFSVDALTKDVRDINPDLEVIAIEDNRVKFPNSFEVEMKKINYTNRLMMDLL